MIVLLGMAETATCRCRYILTAAHCVLPTRRNPQEAVEVLLGETDLSQDIDCVTDEDGTRCAPPPQKVRSIHIRYPPCNDYIYGSIVPTPLIF